MGKKIRIIIACSVPLAIAIGIFLAERQWAEEDTDAVKAIKAIGGKLYVTPTHQESPYPA